MRWPPSVFRSALGLLALFGEPSGMAPEGLGSGAIHERPKDHPAVYGGFRRHGARMESEGDAYLERQGPLPPSVPVSREGRPPSCRLNVLALPRKRPTAVAVEAALIEEASECRQRK